MGVDLIRYSGLDLRHLRLMLAVSEARNLTSAARRLRLTTSALSHQLRQLESLTDSRMFFREGKSMRPTKAGEMLIQTAERVLESVHEAEDRLRQRHDLTNEVIRLCAHCYTGYHWLPAVLKLFNAAHRNVELRIVPEETRDPFPALGEKRLDLVLSFTPPANGRFAAQPLFSDEQVLLISRHHRLVKQRFVQLRELKEENLILYPRTMSESYFVRQYLAPLNVYPKQFTSITLTEAILEMVRANLGVTVVARWAAEQVNRKGLVTKRLTRSGLSRTWYAITREGPAKDSPLAALIDSLCQVMQPFIQSRQARGRRRQAITSRPLPRSSSNSR
jgi:LysR family transcriptional regulator for metE and metH